MPSIPKKLFDQPVYGHDRCCSEHDRGIGAPVGMAQAADGALPIAEEVGNAVWSVTGSAP